MVGDLDEKLGIAVKAHYKPGIQIICLACLLMFASGFSREVKQKSTPWKIRTSDLQIRSLSLYPAELRAHDIHKCKPILYLCQQYISCQNVKLF